MSLVSALHSIGLGATSGTVSRSGVSVSASSSQGLTLSVPLVGVKVSFSPQALAKAAGPVGEAVADVVEGVGSGAGQVLEGLATVGDKAIDLVGDVVGYGALAARGVGLLIDEFV
jgi:hypothetical protein